MNREKLFLLTSGARPISIKTEPIRVRIAYGEDPDAIAGNIIEDQMIFTRGIAGDLDLSLNDLEYHNGINGWHREENLGLMLKDALSTKIKPATGLTSHLVRDLRVRGFRGIFDPSSWVTVLDACLEENYGDVRPVLDDSGRFISAYRKQNVHTSHYYLRKKK